MTDLLQFLETLSDVQGQVDQCTISFTLSTTTTTTTSAVDVKERCSV